MMAYLLRRVGWMFVILFGVATVTFFVAYMVPGDPARMIAGPGASAATIDSIRHQLGLDQPAARQYIDYMGRLVTGNLGISFLHRVPVLTAIFQRLGTTVLIALGGVFWELAIGIPVGIAAAWKPRSIWDRAGTAFALLGLSAPPFWLGLLLLYYLAFQHSIFPLGGVGHPLLWYLILPTFTLGIGGAAWYTRMLRSSMLEILRSPYMQMARAKGMPSRILLWRHAMPNAVIPLITMAGMDLGYFLGGVLIIEVVFGIPGVGQQAWQAVQVLDIPMIMGTVLIAAVFIVLMNVIVDLSYALFDPRIRYR